MENKYQRLIQEGYDFNFSTYMDGGWKLFKSEAGNFIGYTLLFFIISFVSSMVPLVGGIANSLIQNALTAGYFVFCLNMVIGKAQFSHFFEGFQSFGDLLMYQVALFFIFLPIIGLLFGLIFPFELFWELINGDSEAIQEIAGEWSASVQEKMMLFMGVGLLVLLGSIYIGISYLFVIPLIVLGKLKFWDAMETSRKIIGKNFISFLGLLILMGILTIIVTVVTCGLALLVMIPYIQATLFSAYKEIVGLDDNTVSEDTNTITL